MIKNKLTVILLIFTVFSIVNIVKADDIGNITIEGLKENAWVLPTSSIASTIDVPWTVFVYDKTNYTYISWFRINDSGNGYTLAKSQYSSHFNCVTNCTGEGDAYYNQNITGENVTWVFSSATVFSGSPITISYLTSDFPTTINENLDLSHQATPGCVASVNSTQPICAEISSLFNRHQVGISYYSGTSVRTINNYIVNWTSNSLGIGANLTIIKDGTIATQIKVIDVSSNVITEESSPIITNYNAFFVSQYGIGVDIYLANGGHTKKIINTTSFLPAVSVNISGNITSNKINYNKTEKGRLNWKNCYLI